MVGMLAAVAVGCGSTAGPASEATSTIQSALRAAVFGTWHCQDLGDDKKNFRGQTYDVTVGEGTYRINATAPPGNHDSPIGTPTFNGAGSWTLNGRVLEISGTIPTIATHILPESFSVRYTLSNDQPVTQTISLDELIYHMAGSPNASTPEGRTPGTLRTVGSPGNGGITVTAGSDGQWLLGITSSDPRFSCKRS